jgi:putative hydrolase
MKKEFIKRFRSLTGDDFLSDMHLHTTWTDGASSVSEMIAAAEKKGLKRIALTDHVRGTSTYCEPYEQEIDGLARLSSLRVHVGFEAKVMDFEGRLDLPDYCSRDKHVIIGSVHSIPSADGRFVSPEDSASTGDLEKNEFELCMALIASGQADILGHAGGMSMVLLDGFNLKLFEEIIAACSKTDTAFEISSRYHARIFAKLAALLEKHNPLVSLGSDAHNTHDVGKCHALLTMNPGGQ